VALVLGVGYGFTAEDGQIGPGFLPVLVGGFILAASLAEIGRLYLAPRGRSTAALGGIADELSAEAEDTDQEARAGSPASSESDGEKVAHDDAADGSADAQEQTDAFARTTRQRQRTVVMVFAILFVSILLVQVIGMLLALSVMMLSLITLVQRRPVVPALLMSAGTLLVAYLIFVQLLGVPVPQGMLGIL